MNKDEMIRTQASLLKAYIEHVESLQERVNFLESKCMMIEPEDDKDYPFSRILNEEIDD